MSLRTLPLAFLFSVLGTSSAVASDWRALVDVANDKLPAGASGPGQFEGRRSGGQSVQG